MVDKHRHIDQLKEESKDFFAKGEIAWNKSETEVWGELEKLIGKKPSGKTISLYSTILKWSVAALFLLLLGIGSVVVFYSKTVETLPGQNLVAELPDGSSVELNAGSGIKYYPLRWTFERKLKFEGEAFFSVQKGEKFEVESENGITQVVGTSFNIYARDEDYRVTCFTGKVMVVSNSNESILLLPNEHVEIENGELVMSPKYNVDKSIDWRIGRFDFTGRPLKEVCGEIERHFAVKIQIQPQLVNRSFSSNFSKPDNVEDALDIVCNPMQLRYTKLSDNVYLIEDKYN